MDYVSMVETECFLFEQAKRQEEMKRYIKECQILASGKNVAVKLNSLNEDLKEAATGLWQKIKTIFTRIWLKFLENLDRFVKSDADYLKTYQGIILNKKAPEVNWNMPDYDALRKRCFAGIPDFNQYVNDTFVQDMASSAGKATAEKENAEELKTTWAYEIHKRFCIVDKIKTDLQKDEDFAAVVKEYFSGGEERETPASELNMTDLYNTCFSAETIIAELKKTQTKYNKWIEDVEKRYNAEYKKMNDLVNKHKEAQKAENQANKDAYDASKTPEERNAAKAKSAEAQAQQDAAKQEMDKQRDELEKAKTAADKAKAEAVRKENLSYDLYSNVYGRVLNELTMSTSSTSGSGTSKTYNAAGPSSQTSGAGVSTNDTNSKVRTDAEANRKYQEKSASAAAADSAVSGAKDAEAIGGLDENTLREFSSNVTTYATLCTETITTIFGAKCNGITKMRNDYMQIIRYHVKFWLGKPNDSDDNVKTQVATPNPNVNQSVKAPGM